MKKLQPSPGWVEIIGGPYDGKHFYPPDDFADGHATWMDSDAERLDQGRYVLFQSKGHALWVPFRRKKL